MYFSQIIKAVQHFHSKGICHRDLKPENILIDDSGNAKIIDFGFSSSGKPYLTSYCGTPPFMCPEIVQKRPYSGIKADIWALGVMLFLMTNGKLPFKATSEQ
jgi:serine/threonine protein kinase